MGLVCWCAGCTGDFEDERQPPTGGKFEVNPETGEVEVVDELCFGVDRPNYTKFFEGPLFRGIDHLGDDRFALVDGANLWVSDRADPETFIHPLGYVPLAGHSLDVRAVGDTVFVATGERGVLVFDVKDPKNPRASGRLATPDFALSLAVSGSYLVVGAARAGVMLFDIASTSDPKLIATVDTPGLVADVAVDSGLIYVADCTGLVIVGGAEAAKAKIVGQLAVKEGAVKGVSVSSGVAALAGDGHGAYFVDVANPSQPQLKGRYEQYGERFFVNAVDTLGRTAYLASGDEALTTIDFTDPTGPTRLQATPIDPIEVRLIGETLYSLGNFRRAGERVVEVLSASAARLPTPVRSYRQAKPNLKAHLEGKVLTALRHDTSLVRVDLGDAASPRIMWSGKPALPSEARGFQVRGPFAAVWGELPLPRDPASPGTRPKVKPYLHVTEFKADGGYGSWVALPERYSFEGAEWLGNRLLVRLDSPYWVAPSDVVSATPGSELKPGDSTTLKPLPIEDAGSSSLYVEEPYLMTVSLVQAPEGGGANPNRLVIRAYRVGDTDTFDLLAKDEIGVCSLGVGIAPIRFGADGLGYSCSDLGRKVCKRLDAGAHQFVVVAYEEGKGCKAALEGTTPPPSGRSIGVEFNNNANLSWIHVGEFSTAYNGQFVWNSTEGNHLFVVDEKESLRAYDTSDPAILKELSRLRL